MVSTWRSFFIFGTLVVAVALLAPATAQAQPSAVAIAKTSPSSFDKLVVTWVVDAATATDGYRIFYRKQGDTTPAGGSSTTDPTAANNSGHVDVDGRATKTVTLTGLDHNSYYRAAIAPVDENGVVGTLVVSTDTDASGSAMTDMAGPPAPPRNVTATGGDKTFMVKWEAPYAGEAGLTIKEYRVQKRQVSGGLFGDWVPDTGDDKGGKKVDGDTTMITFKDLKNGVTYQARVMATSSAGVAGDYSVHTNDESTPGDEAATVGGDDMDDDDDMEETPALPLVGILALFAGLLGAARARLRR